MVGSNAVINEPMNDETKERMIKRAKSLGYLAKPNMAGGITIFPNGIPQGSEIANYVEAMFNDSVVEKEGFQSDIWTKEEYAATSRDKGSVFMDLAKHLNSVGGKDVLEGNPDIHLELLSNGDIQWSANVTLNENKDDLKMKKLKLRNIIRESIKELTSKNLLTEITAQDCITQYPGARSAAIFDVNTGNINTMGHRLCLYNYQNPSVSPQVGMAFNQAGVIYRITEIAIPGQPLSVSTSPSSTLQGVTFINNNVDEVYGNECDPTLAVFAPIQSPQYGCVSQPPAVIEGCMDPLASNYDATATQDDGSCMYPAGSGTTATLDRGPQMATPDRTKNDPNVTQDNPQVRRMRELANIK
jgi:hypothetical protein